MFMLTGLYVSLLFSVGNSRSIFKTNIWQSFSCSPVVIRLISLLYLGNLFLCILLTFLCLHLSHSYLKSDISIASTRFVMLLTTFLWLKKFCIRYFLLYWFVIVVGWHYMHFNLCKSHSGDSIDTTLTTLGSLHKLCKIGWSKETKVFVWVLIVVVADYWWHCEKSCLYYYYTAAVVTAGYWSSEQQCQTFVVFWRICCHA